MLLFYDFEVFEQDWLVVIKDPINKLRWVIVNNRDELIKFYEEHKDEIWVGFNSRGYDQYILKAILLGLDPYELSQFVVKKKRKAWQFSDLFYKKRVYNYDVFKGKTDNGLKTLEAFMGHNIHESSVSFDIGRKLNAAELAEVIKYCDNDVDELIEVFNIRIDDFKTHLAMLNEFNLPLKHISKTTAQLIAVILGSHKKSYDDEWDIFLPDTLKLSKYKHVADWFLKNRSTENSYVVNVAGIEHTFADGGLHGAIRQYQYKVQPDELMILVDVSSMYPSIMLEYDLISRSVTDKARFKHIYDMNIELKILGDPRRPTYKLICNTAYGCMGDEFNAMYDPRNRRLVCIYGQLFQLDLIEKLEPYIKLIQSNTDGILFVIKRKDFEKVDDIVYEWESRTRLNTEFEYYSRIYQKDVNNYLAVPVGPLYNEKGKPRWKCKGPYIKKLSILDNDLPIVNEAMVNFMLKDVAIEDTIYNCDELIKFQKIFKLSDNYDYVVHNGEQLFNKSYRVFASTNDNDSYLGKVKDDVGTVEKFANSPDHCFIENGNIVNTTIPTILDKEWYVDLTYKRLGQYGVI